MPVPSGPGSIAFVGFNADGNDNLAFVAFEDIDAGTTIHFTNNNWDGSAFDPNNGTWSFTASAAIAAGTVVRLDDLAGDTPTSNLGDVVKSGTHEVDDGNEVIYAYVGELDAPDTFLTAVASDGFGNGDDLFGTGLVAGETAVDFDALDGDLDVAEYTGRRVSIASFDELRAMVNDHTNWVPQDGGGDQSADGIFPDVPFSEAPFTVDADANAVSFAADSLTVTAAEGDAGTSLVTFTVVRTGSLDGEVTVTGSIDARGVADAADFGGTLPTEFTGTIPAGSATGTVTVEISGDTLFERDEAFTLTLESAANPAIAAYVADEDAVATAVIENDDAAPVDIAFVGYNVEGAVNLAFVALGEIPAGTVIHFTDRTWLGDGFSNSDNAFSFTATADVPAGAIVTIDGLAAGHTPVSNFGAIEFTLGTDRNYSVDSDQFYAYLGEPDAPTAFLTAITGARREGALDNTGLVEGETAIVFDGGIDIAAYTGPRHGAGDLAEFRAALHDVASWDAQSKNPYPEENDGYGPEIPFSREGFSTDANPQTVNFAADSLTVEALEGDAGGTLFTFTVERSGGTTGAVEFSGTLALVDVDADDFGGTVPAFTGTIPAGATSTTVTVTVSGDIAFEADERFDVALDTAGNADAPVVIGTTAHATATIVNDDVPQEIAFADEAVSIAEGDAGTTTITFTLVRSGGTAPAGEVAFSGSIAAAGVDADDFGGTLPTTFAGVFADGAATATVSFEVSGDTVVEVDEAFTLTLDSAESDTTPVTLGAATSATGTIVDDEPLPSIAFVGFNGDGEDDLAFAVLNDIAAGTVIHFSDANWNGTAFPANSEAHISWTATEAVSAGSVVLLGGLAYGATPSASIGAIDYSGRSGNTINHYNEAVFAYVGEVAQPARFIAAIANETFSRAFTTLDGTGLVEGVDAISLASIEADVNVGAYDGPRHGLDNIADYKALINDPANWVIDSEGSGSGEDNSANGIYPDTPFSDAPFIDSDMFQTVGFADAEVSVVEGDAGTTLLTFTLERSGQTAGELAFSGSVATAGVVDADDFGGTLPTEFSGTFADGETTATVTIEVSGDTGFEGDEPLTLTLADAQAGANAATVYLDRSATTATGTILNDDAGPASIAFVGRNGTGDGGLDFVALGDIAAGTTITFTDRSWNGEAFESNGLIGAGSVWTWTATADIAAGSVVTMAGLNAGFEATSNLGDIVFLDEAERDIGENDNLYAFVGTVDAPEAFLTAMSHSWFTPPNPNVYVTGLLDGTGLVEGESALLLSRAFHAISGYAGPRDNHPSVDVIRQGVFDARNWVGQEDADGIAGDGIAPDLPLDATPFTIDPAAQLIGFAADSLAVVKAEGDTGTTTFTFTVERMNGTTGELSFEGIVLPHSAASGNDGTTLTDADFAGSVPASFSGVIADGATTGTVTIEIAGDTRFEPDEGFRLRLTEGSNDSTNVGVGGNTEAAAVIENDDARGADVALTAIDFYGDQSLSLVAIGAIAAGTTIHITNRFWDGETFYEETGTVWSFTAGADIAAGTVFTIEDLAGTPASAFGTVSASGAGRLEFHLDHEGAEDVYLYQGTTDTPDVFLTAFSTSSLGGRDNPRDPDAPGISVLLNTGLTEHVDALSQVGGVAAFVGPRAGYADADALRAALSDQGNWRGQDMGDHTPADALFPDVPASDLPFALDPAAQVVGFIEPLAIAKAEQDAGGSTVYTFTIGRSGGTSGAIEFTGHVLTGEARDGAAITAEDFGGVAPTFSGTIAEGESTATIEIVVSGDDDFEGDEIFTVELDTIVNTAGEAVGAGVHIAEGVIVDYDAQPDGIDADQNVSGTIELGDGDRFVIAEDGSLALDGDAFRWIEDGTSIVENHGLIRVDSLLSTTSEGTFILNNAATGVVEGEWDPDGDIEEGSVIIVNNAGLMQLHGRLFDFHDVVKGGGRAEMHNLAGGLMLTTEADSDMIRPSDRGLVTNAGIIRMSGFGDSGDAIDFQDNVGGVVENYAGGTIIGARHAVTGDEGVTVLNEAGALMVGANGGAVNIDSDGSEGARVFVTNRGRMEGRSGETSDSDGDAVDVDGLLTLVNHGFVGGMGHHGRHDGEPNISEAIAIGGGDITNHAGGEIYGYGRAIQVDNSENDDAFGSTAILNKGLIHGDGNGPEGNLREDELIDYDPVGNEAINLVGDYADELDNRGTIVGGVAMGGGDDVLRNTGRMEATGGNAVDMGAGDDRFTGNGTVIGTIALGEGDDTLTAGDGGVAVEAGDGDDRVKGGEGDDRIDGGAGFDDLRGEGGADWLFGGAHADAVRGGEGEDTVIGSGGDDTLFGEEGADTVIGGKGADRIDAGDGDDAIDGGTGDDRLFGGDGADDFAFDADAGSDTIADFSVTDGDTLTFSAALFADLAAFTDAARQQGDHVVVDLGAGDALRILYADLEDFGGSTVLFA